MDTKHSPTPWRAVAYNENSPGDYKPAQVLDANNLPVVYLRDAGAAATAALIVESVNSHAALTARVAELEGALRDALTSMEHDCYDLDDPGTVILRARALLAKKES